MSSPERLIQLRGRVLEEQKLGLESAWMLEGMPVSYRIELDEQEWGQLLDGLECRAESWRRAAEYLRTGEMPDGEFFIIEECSDEEEADGLATCYEAIIQNIQTQMEDQL